MKAIADSMQSMRRVFADQQQLLGHLAPAIGLQKQLSEYFTQMQIPRILIADAVWKRLQLPILSLNSDILRQMIPAPRLLERLVPPVFPNVQVIAEAQASMQDWMQPIHKYLRLDFEPLRELARRVGRVEQVTKAFRSYNLWLAPSMPPDLVQKVVEFHRRKVNAGAVHSMVSRYYARREWRLLGTALQQWEKNAYFSGRMTAMRQAFDAHQRGHYAVSVPTLLLHVEGIAAGYVQSKKLMPKLGGKTKEVIVSALQGTPCSLLDVTTYCAVHGLLECVENDIYVYVDFDKAYRKLQREKKLIGHAIRHGRQPTYDSRMNSLQLFLLVDVLSLLK